MSNILKKVGGAVLGLIVMIAYWEVRGCVTGKGHSGGRDIPAAVWGGGPVTFTIEVELSEPGQVHLSFGRHQAADEEYVAEFGRKVPAGKSSVSINAPPHITGTFEVSVENPGVGATAMIITKRNGVEIARDEQKLEQPLRDGEAFFAQVHVRSDETPEEGDDEESND